jgi:hypothetical protein
MRKEPRNEYDEEAADRCFVPFWNELNERNTLQR